MSSAYALRRLPRFAFRAAPRSPASLRSFHVSRACAAGKESALDQDGRAEQVEKQKQEQLQGQREGNAQWKDGLASDSESIVKADRNELSGSKDTISELQKETSKAAEKEQKGR